MFAIHRGGGATLVGPNTKPSAEVGEALRVHLCQLVHRLEHRVHQHLVVVPLLVLRGHGCSEVAIQCLCCEGLNDL